MSGFKAYSKGMGYVVLTIVTLTALGWVLKPASMFAERVAIKASHQYKEGMAQQAAIYESQLIELDIQLTTQTDPDIITGLVNQQRFVKSRLRAITLNK